MLPAKVVNRLVKVSSEVLELAKLLIAFATVMGRHFAEKVKQSTCCQSSLLHELAIEEPDVGVKGT